MSLMLFAYPGFSREAMGAGGIEQIPNCVVQTRSLSVCGRRLAKKTRLICRPSSFLISDSGAICIRKRGVTNVELPEKRGESPGLFQIAQHAVLAKLLQLLCCTWPTLAYAVVLTFREADLELPHAKTTPSDKERP